jgi:methyl-accepting chemotaxis protein
MMAHLATASEQLDAAAREQRTVAEQAGVMTRTVAAAAEQTSANVGTVASATEELSATIQEISGSIGQAAGAAAAGVNEAQGSAATVQDLAQAANRIGDVVALIRSIAEQTNLLALNATIEAARAGEAGRGFAVVAGEVKDLAGQTAKATEEIARQIAAIQAASQSSVAALEGIRLRIGGIDGITVSVASAMAQQGAATGEIARSVQNAASGTREVTSNIAVLAEQVARTAHSAERLVGVAQDIRVSSKRLKACMEGFVGKLAAA